MNASAKTTALVKMAQHPAAAAAATELLKRLAHPGRLMIVCRLAAGEATVSELEGELGLHQPGLSQQLAELRNARIIEPHRFGKTWRYRLIDANAAALADAVCHRFCSQIPEQAIDCVALPLTDASVKRAFGAAIFARVGQSV